MATQRQMTRTGLLFTQADAFTALSGSLTGSPETALFSDTLPGMAIMGVSNLAFNIALEAITGAVAPTLTLRLKIGPAVLILTNAVQLTASMTTSKPLVLQGRIMGLNSNNAQYAYSQLLPSALVGAVAASQIVSASWSLDTTQAFAVSITAQFGSVTTGTTLTPQLISIQLN